MMLPVIEKPIIEEPNKVHMALNVRDLAASIAFYKMLFGLEPAKVYSDYAKFEVESPPLVFSLNPSRHQTGGVLSHIGLRMTCLDEMNVVRERLEKAHIPIRLQENIGGCYALQTKFWLTDPDQNSWEIYIVQSDLSPDETCGAIHFKEATLEKDPAETRELVYRGPFKEIVDRGRVFPRGQRIRLPIAVWEDLRDGPAYEQFFFFASNQSTACNS